MARVKSIICVSVCGGWQSGFSQTEITFGPIFNKVQDLWNWQRANLYQKV